VQEANEVAAAASPTVRAKSRRLITGHMLVFEKWACKSTVQAGSRIPGLVGLPAYKRVVGLLDVASPTANGGNDGEAFGK
jgi:hypothetical protein